MTPTKCKIAAAGKEVPIEIDASVPVDNLGRTPRLLEKGKA